jgi:uncharacterized membrane protein YcaP (DUF421 family)
MMNELLGLDAEKLVWYQMGIRAFVIYILSFFYIKIAGIRTFSNITSFDRVTGLIMGAILGRAIVTNQPFGGTLIACLVIVLLHRLTAIVSFANDRAEGFLKGKRTLLYSNGKINSGNSKKAQITADDIKEAVHAELNEPDMKSADKIFLEKSGKISVLKKQD